MSFFKSNNFFSSIFSPPRYISLSFVAQILLVHLLLKLRYKEIRIKNMKKIHV